MRPVFNRVKYFIVNLLNNNFQLFGAPKTGLTILEKELITPACTKNNPDPIYTETQLHWKFRVKKEINYPATFVAGLKQARVWGNSGIVINNNVLINEVSREYNNTGNKLSIFRQWKFQKPVYKNATIAVISAAGANVYYHWMMDIVPRVELLIKSGQFNSIDYFIVNFEGLHFQKELLQRLAIPESKVISCNHYDFHLQAKQLVVPSFVSPNDAPSQEACLFLRKLFAQEMSAQKPFRKLYIQRKKGRTITNEQQLLEVLYTEGFEVVQLEQLTVAQQAKLFSEAEFVLGPHGAGLTNIVFCAPGTKIIDLFSPEWINPCYWIIASHLHLHYAYLTGEGKTFPENYESFGQNTDIIVNLPKFNKLLNLVKNSP